MGNAIGKIVEELLEVFKKNYKKPRLWICIGGIIVCFVLLFPYIDSNFLYFSRMEKRINILERVMELDQEKINSNQFYQNEYQSILQEMNQQSERTIYSVMNSMTKYINGLIATGQEDGNRWIKCFTGAGWFWIITICVPFMNTFKKSSDKVLAFIMMLGISIIVGCFFSIVPIIIAPWFNYIVIPILQIVLFVAIMSKGDKAKKA